MNNIPIGNELVTLDGGTLSGTTASLSGNVSLTANSIIDASAGSIFTLSGEVSGTGFGITKTGAGELILTNAHPYTGSTNINAGTLTVTNGLNDTSAITVASGATYNLGVSDTIASIGGAGNVSLNTYTLTVGSATNTTLSGNISGSGALVKQGSGILTLSGTNIYTGGTTINAGTLNLGSQYALATNQVTSNGASLMMENAVTALPSLIVNGDVTLVSGIRTQGAQTYNGAVTLAYGNETELGALTLTTDDNNVTFNGTIRADSNSKITDVNKRSLWIDAGTGTVTFNDRVGLTQATGIDNTSTANIYNLNVTAANIKINADITTLEEQLYDGAVDIGDNGTNGTIRTLLSVDPRIEFLGTIDDAATNTHSLIVKAITFDTAVPIIIFAKAIGSTRSLLDISAITGRHIGPAVGDVSTDPLQQVGELTIGGSVTTLRNQSYQANVINLGSSNASQLVFTTKNGKISFVVGQGIAGVAGTKVMFKYSNSSSLSSESQRALKSAGIPVVFPVFSYQDASLLMKQIKSVKNSIDTSGSKPTVKVGDAYVKDCDMAKDCQAK
jgi:autotransporter-associated beta strand protein